jgi:hypothetical protein
MVSINNDALTEKILAGERIAAEEALYYMNGRWRELGAWPTNGDDRRSVRPTTATEMKS